MQNLLKYLNDARVRSVVAGGVGGLLGWMVAEVLLGRPESAIGTLFFGLFAGLGIGAALGAAEGAFTGNWLMARRGLLLGLAVGAGGGAVGAMFGQTSYALSSGGSSMFSGEMAKRLKQAGAKKGSVEIGLLWENRNDLDLHVVDPSGEEIFYADRRAASGGELDVDKNASCFQNVTDAPVEHVVWTREDPPEGEYKIFVNHYANCGVADPTPFRVELVVDQKQIASLEGQIKHGDVKKLVHTFTLPIEEEGGAGLLGFLARILGWTIFGGLLGCAEGAARKSPLALRNAALGGLIGGAVGGLLFAMLQVIGLTDVVSRLLGLVILGACIGLWIVIIEKALSAVLRVRSGRYEGREIFLDRSEMRIGRNDSLEIFLGADPEIAAHHATISRDPSGFVIAPAEGSVMVNGKSVSRQLLRHDDALQLGQTRLVYKNKAAPSDSGASAVSGVSGDGQAEKTPPRPQGAPRKGPPPPPPPPRPRPK